MNRPPIVNGVFLLGSNDARWGERRITAHVEKAGDIGELITARFGGRVTISTESEDVARAMRRCGIAVKEAMGDG